MNINKNKLIPFILTAAVVILDQVSKILITKYIPMHTIGMEFFGDFLRIVHVSNTGVAFSIGHSMPLVIRRILFGIIPLIVIGIVTRMYLKTEEFTKLQQWAICGIIGGGLGNLIDRFLRKEGVVDFIDFKFFGIFGLERWPTFNIADSAVVVCGIIIFITFIIKIIKEKKTNI